jgi:hypothetical protein
MGHNCGPFVRPKKFEQVFLPAYRRMICTDKDGGAIIGAHSVSPEIPREDYFVYHEFCRTYGEFGAWGGKGVGSLFPCRRRPSCLDGEPLPPTWK